MVDNIRDLGGVCGVRLTGEATRPPPSELWFDSDGDSARPKGGDVALIAACACEVLVALWIKLGGAVAIARAFARLAAIAAATLLFFGAACDEPDASTDIRAAASGSGHAFSRFLRLGVSRALRINFARSDHTLSKVQKAPRAASRTPMLGSWRAFFTIWSRRSAFPEASMTPLDRAP